MPVMSIAVSTGTTTFMGILLAVILLSNRLRAAGFQLRPHAKKDTRLARALLDSESLILNLADAVLPADDRGAAATSSHEDQRDDHNERQGADRNPYRARIPAAAAGTVVDVDVDIKLSARLCLRGSARWLLQRDDGRIMRTRQLRGGR